MYFLPINTLYHGLNICYSYLFYAILGHVSVRTTERYARADAKLKREAIEAASKEIVPKEVPQWDNNISLKSWLKDLCKPKI